MKRKLVAFIVSLCLVVLAKASTAATFINGGLETLSGDTFQTVLPGSSYAGWNSVGGGDIEFTTTQTAVPGGFFGPVAEGSGCLDLNGVAFQGAVSQMLTNEPGVVYRLRFAMSGNPGILGQPRRATKTMDVYWGGTNSGSFAFTHLPSDTQTNMRWEYHEILVTGKGIDELRFASTSADYNDAGPVIDNISIAPLEETLSLRVSQVELCWNSVTNFTYQIEYRSSLTTNSWVPFGSPRQGSGGVICTNDTVSMDEPHRFYRVLRVP